MFRRVLLATALSAAFVTAASAATVHYSARLNGRSEVPKTTSKGTGTFDATFDTQSKALNYTLTFSGLTGPATAAHFHGPAAAGVNAGVQIPIAAPASPISGQATLSDAQISDLKAGKWYFNVHTAAHPTGEIRGQVATAP